MKTPRNGRNQITRGGKPVGKVVSLTGACTPHSVFILPVLLQNVSSTEASGTKWGGKYLNLSSRNILRLLGGMNTLQYWCYRSKRRQIAFISKHSRPK